MENKILKYFKEIYFMVLGVLMYYFLNEYIDLGLHITHRHVFALLLFISAGVMFLVKPDVSRGIIAFKSAAVYSTPLFVVMFVSLFIWFVDMADVSVITRGLSSYFVYTNMFSFALASGVFLYLFGEKGIWYNLVCALISNILIILTIIIENGIGNYFSEFITLIMTFADETGEIIVQAEVHELAFCLGAFMIYMLLKPKRSIAHLILFAILVFCFLSAFKRIAFIAIALALIFGWLLKSVSKHNDKFARGLLIFLTLFIIALLIGYVAIIKADVFALLEQAGINTSGRVGIYNSVDKFYEFSPEFLGNGIGFVTYQLNTNIHIGVAAIHNDFLQYYIDLGFWGYIIWLLSITLLRVCYFGKNGKTENAIISFALTVYLVIVSSTDNTMSYPLLTEVLALLMMSGGFDEDVKNMDKKLFGYVLH